MTRTTEKTSWTNKRRYTALATDNRPRLSTKEAEARFLNGGWNYPRYDIAYTNSVWRYNYKQMRILKRKILRITEELKTKRSKVKKCYLNTFKTLLMEIISCQKEINFRTGTCFKYKPYLDLCW